MFLCWIANQELFHREQLASVIADADHERHVPCTDAESSCLGIEEEQLFEPDDGVPVVEAGQLRRNIG
ncbi:hypothetical protein D3C85_1222710 [compost metagenome]